MNPCMDLKNLISRIEIATAPGTEQTIARWQRLGLSAEPKECLSDRPIFYDREQADCAESVEVPAGVSDRCRRGPRREDRRC
jgi:hypothetical protein